MSATITDNLIIKLVIKLFIIIVLSSLPSAANPVNDVPSLSGTESLSASLPRPSSSGTPTKIFDTNYQAPDLNHDHHHHYPPIDSPLSSSVIGTLPLANSPMVILSQTLSNGSPRPPIGNHWNVFATSIERFNLKVLQKMESERPNDNLIFSPLSLALSLSKIASGSLNASRLQILETLGVRSSFSSFRWMNRDIFRSQSSLSKRGVHVDNNLELPSESKSFITANFLSTLLSVYKTSVQTLDNQYGDKDLDLDKKFPSFEAETKVRYENNLNPNLFSVLNGVSIKNGVHFDESSISQEPDQLIDGSDYFLIRNANATNGSFLHRGFNGRSSINNGARRTASGMVQSVIKGTFQVASVDNFVLVKIPLQNKLSLEIFIPKSTLRSEGVIRDANPNIISSRLSYQSILSAISQSKPMKLRIKMPKVDIKNSGNFAQILASEEVGVKNIFNSTLAELSETGNAFGMSVGDISYRNFFSFPCGRDANHKDEEIRSDAKITEDAERIETSLRKEHRSADARRSYSSNGPYRVYVGGVRRDISSSSSDSVTGDNVADKKDADKFIPITIHAPFLFLVRDEVTGHNLFLGKLINPFNNNNH